MTEVQLRDHVVSLAKDAASAGLLDQAACLYALAGGFTAGGRYLEELTERCLSYSQWSLDNYNPPVADPVV